MPDPIDPPPVAGTVLRVVAKDTAAEGVVTVTLAHPDGRRLADWTPGAHIDLVLPIGLTRQYSLCGDRWDAYTFRIGVLREPASRGGSAYIHDRLAVGDRVHVGGPRNNFTVAPSTTYLFVAGGIGITPLLPMIRQAESTGARWRLLYAGRTRATMAFLDELAAYGDRVTVAPRDEGERIDLSAWLPRAARADARVYACGPRSLLDGIDRLCQDWPPGRLRTERFVANQYSNTLRDTPFRVELTHSQRTVTVAPDRSVLDAIQEAGVAVLSSCRTGVCGTCETTVLAGEPDHRDCILDDRERDAGDCMFPCVSRSRSELLVLDL